jgi:hypothetical protein
MLWTSLNNALVEREDGAKSLTPGLGILPQLLPFPDLISSFHL